MTLNSNLAGLLRQSTSTLLRNNVYYVLALVFTYYFALRIKKFRGIRVKFVGIPDEIFHRIILKYFEISGDYVDASSCAFGRLEYIENFERNWVNICCSNSSKKYRIHVFYYEDNLNNKEDFTAIYVSETTFFNIQKTFGYDNEDEYFTVPACREPGNFADEIKISLVSNPHECTDELIDNALKNYFLNPKFLRKSDFFSIDVKEYAPGFFYTLSSPQLRILNFKVNSVTIDGKRTTKACYVIKDQSSLIQEGKIHEYLPRKFKLSIRGGEGSCLNEEIGRGLIENCPRFLEKYLHQLGSCVLPFITTDDWMGLRPIFLVEGPQGCGKHQLIDSLSQRLGLNFLNINCSEIQSLSPSQTEAKLRIAISNAEACIPCILKLTNIQIFGKNPENKIDERITSNFTQQLTDLYSKRLSHPLIIIATSETPEIPAEVNRNFMEKLQINSLNQNERIDLINWFLKIQRIDHSLDLSNISGMSSDLLMNDLKALTQNAIKNRWKKSRKSKEDFELKEKDFLQSYKVMQSIFSDEIGAPKIPEVHWDDIGGLANLKHEILRRIEIPLMKNSGIKSSGILLYGPPGTGKTLLAKAVATECKLNFLSVKGPELLNMYVGQSEKNVRDVFERAKNSSPCIIFFDELDALAPNRGRSGDSGGVMDRVVSQLLAEMDGLGSSTSTFIIAATNRPDLIDSALLRPGRFDKLLYVGIYSDEKSKLSVLKAITRKFSLENCDVLQKIAASLPDNLTGADLQAVCSNAWLNAAKRVIRKYESEAEDGKSRGKLEETVEVMEADFIEAIDGLVPSVSQDELRKYEQLHGELTSKKKTLRKKKESG